MNRKTILILVGVIAALCLCSVAVGAFAVSQMGNVLKQSTTNDPAKVSEASKAIADYTIPEGYKQSMSMSIMGITMVGMTGAESNDLIMLIQYPAGMQVNQAQMEEQLRKTMQQGSNSQNYTFTQTGTLERVIRGQKVTLSVSESNPTSGNTVRQALGVFQGKGGLAMVMIMGSVDTWNQEAIDTFLSSMK